MAGPFGSSSSGPFGGSTSSSPSGGGNIPVLSGALHFGEHLLGDIKDAALGLPAGIAHIATQNPVKSIQEIGHTTWQTWSPLFHGHVGTFMHNFEAHPLAPLLDVASVFTGGAGLAARGLRGLETAGVDLSPTLAKIAHAPSMITHDVVPGAPEAAVKHLSPNPLVNLRQRASHQIGLEMAQHMPKWFGEQGAVRDLSPAGHQMRFLRQDVATRGAGAAASLGQALPAWRSGIAAMVKAGHDINTAPFKTAQLVENHMRNQLIDHAISAPPSRLIQRSRVVNVGGVKQKLNFYKPMKGYNFVAASPKVAKDGLKTPQDFVGYMESFGPRHMTPFSNKALRDANGNFLVVPNHAAKVWSQEGANSANFLSKLAGKSMRAWKWLVLASRPAYLVNNAVGNNFMYMMDFGGAGAFRGLVDAMRQIHGEHAVAKSLGGAMQHLHADWQNKWYLGVHQGFSQEALKTLHLQTKGLPASAAKVVHLATGGFYPITHKVSDTFLRRASINVIMRKNPEVRALMKQGHSFDQAAGMVSQNPVVRNMVQQRVNDALGEYHYLSPQEAKLRQLVPFYTWDRAIMRHGVKLTLNQPTKAAAAATVGLSGTKQNQHLLGDIPDFLKGSIVLHQHGGTARILSTAGLNPYSSIPDVLGAGAALVGGGNISSELGNTINPLVRAGIEQVTGQDMVSGAKIKRHGGGPVFNVLRTATEATPPVALVERLIKGSQTQGKKGPLLFEHTPKDQALAFAGVPLKTLNLARAHQQANQEQGKRKAKSAFG